MTERTETKPKMKKWKKVAFSFVALFLSVGIYLMSIEFWLWRWESPHTPMTVNITEHSDELLYDKNYSALAKSFRSEMDKSAIDLETVSISVAVAIGDTPIWAGTIGLADIEAEETALVTHQYRVGSVSKSITATTLMRLVDQGLIDLDADIATYLPNYPTYEAPITARQLASHMAGVRHYATDLTNFPPTDFYSRKHYNDVNEAIVHFKDDALLFTPGKGFKYSTHGYTLLSAVMQAAAKKPFLNLVDEQLFKPAGMIATAPEDLSKPLPNIVKFYTAEKGLYGNVPMVDLSNKLAGGGFIATPTDIVRMGAAIQSGQLLSSARWLEMVTPQPMFDGSKNPQAYAMGWRHHDTVNILGEDQPIEVIHHGGIAAGAIAFMLIVPEYNISIALASNGRGSQTRGELQLLAYRMTKAILIADNL